MNTLTKALIAEFIGTFALVFIGCGAASVAGPVGSKGQPIGELITVALAFGVTIMIFAYAYGHISGTHINPAVTLGLLTAGKMAVMDAIAYIVAQILGATVGGFALLWVWNGKVMNGMGVTAVNTDAGITVAAAFFLEMIGTFFLVNTVMNAAVSGKAGNLAPVAIGLTVSVGIMFFGGLTGGSMNPARSLGPAIAAGLYDNIWLYLIAPTLGGILAGLLYRYVFAPAAVATPVSVSTAEPSTQPV